ERVSVVTADFGGVWVGLNSRATLAKLIELMRARILERHLDRGVTFVDPATSYVDVDVRIAADAVIHPLTFLQGATRIGRGASVGSDTMSIAPLKVGKRAWTAAGSAIADDVPEGALAVERSKQRIIRGYDDRQRTSHGGRAPGSKRKERVDEPSKREG